MPPSLQTSLDVPPWEHPHCLPSLSLGCPSPTGTQEGTGADFAIFGSLQINLLCCPTDPDTGISDADQYHTYSELTNPQDPPSKDQWDDQGSSTTPCSQTSDDEAKTGSPVKAEPFPTSKKDDFALPTLSLVTTSAGGTEAGKQAEESSQSYAGIHRRGQSWQEGAEGCLGMVALSWGKAKHSCVFEVRHACGQGSLLPFVLSSFCSVPPKLCSFSQHPGTPLELPQGTKCYVPCIGMLGASMMGCP